MNRCVLRVAATALIASAIALSFLAGSTSGQKRHPPVKHPSICGNPTAPCKTIATFQPNDLPFRLPEHAVIYDTELFYAVILKSIRADESDCKIFISEDERLRTQTLFPDHKVFASRCNEPENLGYSNRNRNSRFMAVYAGMTLADANRMLATVKATEKFRGANVRRMRAAFNGT